MLVKGIPGITFSLTITAFMYSVGTKNFVQQFFRNSSFISGAFVTYEYYRWQRKQKPYLNYLMRKCRQIIVVSTIQEWEAVEPLIKKDTEVLRVSIDLWWRHKNLKKNKNFPSYLAHFLRYYTGMVFSNLKSTLIWVTAINLNLWQCRPRSMSPYVVIRPRRINSLCVELKHSHMLL